MGQQTLSRPTARDVMELVSRTAVPSDTAASALEAMEVEGIPLLPVVDPATGQFLGVVLRKALQNGCVRMGHDASTCRLDKHLNRNIPSCGEDEELGEAMLRRSHVVVLDSQRVPLGLVRVAAG
jgi:predicted transcriptional regulator